MPLFKRSRNKDRAGSDKGTNDLPGSNIGGKRLENELSRTTVPEADRHVGGKQDLRPPPAYEMDAADNGRAAMTSPVSELDTMQSLSLAPKTLLSSVYRSNSTTMSTGCTSTSTDFGPDTNPVTQQTLVADSAGLEVALIAPGKKANLYGTGETKTTLPATAPASQSYREYAFHYTNTFTHLIICGPDQQALYFVEVSPFDRIMPDVCLREVAMAGFENLARKGGDLTIKDAKATPIVGTADPMPSTKHIKLALGDPLQPESNTIVVMRNVYEDFKTNSYKYDMTVLGRPQTTYQWTQGPSSDKDRDSNPKEQFTLRSEKGTVATFRNAGVASKKRGALRVYDGFGNEDHLPLIVLSCSALCEKQRRKKVKKGLMLGWSPKQGW